MYRATHFQNYHVPFFNTSECATNYVISFEVYDSFIGLKIFEVMKAGKLAVWPWLVGRYNENTLLDLPSPVDQTVDVQLTFL